ncbi:MAG: serine hydrolase [Cyclobacteriaceae bacterium]
MKKPLLYSFLLLIALLTLTYFLFKKEAYQMYKVLTFFEKEHISENFRSIKDIFNTSKVNAPEIAEPWPISNQQVSLPENIKFEDSTINTKSYLDYTLNDGLLIIQHDSIKYERYSNGFTSEDQHISWSMSKSVISALFGIAIEEGAINSIDETVTDYLPEFAGTGYEGVRIKDVLQMSTGVGFNEDYSDFNSDINIMGRYFALGMPMADFSRTLNRDHEPGTFNHYVSINTQVLGMILVEATGESITDFMQTRLWNKIGAESPAYWIRDKAEMEFALGGLNVTLRDYARLGQLYLDSGRWKGQQIVPEEWVIQSITPDAPHLMPGKRNSATREDGYGFQWWIPEGNQGEFYAIGIYSQYIYINPSKDLVIVMLSSNYHFKYDLEGMHKKIAFSLFRNIAERL